MSTYSIPIQSTSMKLGAHVCILSSQVWTLVCKQHPIGTHKHQTGFRKSIPSISYEYKHFLSLLIINPLSLSPDTKVYLYGGRTSVTASCSGQGTLESHLHCKYLCKYLAYKLTVKPIATLLLACGETSHQGWRSPHLTLEVHNVHI